MKLISARSSFAPRPQYTAKRAPVTFAARSRSSMPSSGPRSQCALGSKSKCRGSPTRRTSRLSASLEPTGTDSCGTFGIPLSISRKDASAAFFLPLQNGDPLADGPHLLLPLTGIDAFAAQFADLDGFRIAAGFQLLGFGNGGAPPLVPFPLTLQARERNR